MGKVIWAALIGVALVIGGAYVVLTSQGSSADDRLQSGDSVSDTTQDSSNSESSNSPADQQSQETDKPGDSAASSDGGSSSEGTEKTDSNSDASAGSTDNGQAANGQSSGSIVTVSDPNDIGVLVNKTHRLPEGYAPDDLVYPDVAFIFDDKVDKRKMRREAADALKELFDAADKDGIELAGVSGYRSESRQKTLFDNYVKRDGEEAAVRYSARPGFSEHQTGLAMDVSGKDGKCAAEDCFAGTDEANWLADHAQEYGFIIRYPEDKESVTGYKYEAWHLRYVGVDLAELIHAGGLTLEEYSAQHETS
ncbi:D-alanyl-D-alanine carboxypeptidase [Paenibacillus cellulosilyticus]|uniref:D-alanyl-D-alanine carboxypeptidase n=1 Tax=Paenibacillus cellulosilyticus TaxID=375489 RepID=A0A2V2YLR3_9BACL|nr:M15 family metallopeptidase [Paenibacillus cellulosilyticus]PWV94411.1 D-alanyl-D-alanine carboxypeptidase [Paenibacillus cellulosilyticus]QKS43904.1 M15 family metallopeptidase [Paenibacillus cellulosilyticus]